jgi:hypothetical protein
MARTANLLRHVRQHGPSYLQLTARGHDFFRLQSTAIFAMPAKRGCTLAADDATWLSDALSKIMDGEPADIALGLRLTRAEMLAAIKNAAGLISDRDG